MEKQKALEKGVKVKSNKELGLDRKDIGIATLVKHQFNDTFDGKSDWEFWSIRFDGEDKDRFRWVHPNDIVTK